MSAEVQKEQPLEHERCRACKSELISGATLCPVCKSYQSRAKAVLFQLAAIAGLVTVLISLLTYITVTFPVLRRTLFWKDSVEIVAYNSAKLVLQNSGDGNVFVSHLYLTSEEIGFSRTEDVETTIKEGEFVTHIFPDESKSAGPEDWRTTPISETAWKKIRSSVRTLNKRCFRWMVFHPSDPTFQMFRTALKDGFRTLPVDATLVFHSGKDGRRIEQRMTMDALLFQNNIPDCATDAAGSEDSLL